MSFVDGRLEGRGGGDLEFVTDGLRVPLDRGRALRAGEVSGTVTLGVRAEALSLPLSRSVEGSVEGASFRATIAIAERLGASTLLHVEVGAHRLVVSIASDRELEPGATVELSIDPGRVHLFDAQGASLLDAARS